MERWALGISLAAVVLAGISAWFTHRQAVAAERANTLSERALARADAADREHREANRVRWRVEQAGPGYILRNLGTETAHRVEAWQQGTPFQSGPIVMDQSDPRGEWLAADSVASGGGLPFSNYPRSIQDGDGHALLVTWSEHPEPVHVALPEEPPQPPTARPWLRDTRGL